jgi:hypothetical protein
MIREIAGFGLVTSGEYVRRRRKSARNRAAEKFAVLAYIAMRGEKTGRSKPV